ncbi:hypothetical protein ONS95_007525 [Cadophora gregata]|uniref:uncharacterized protein n=1 Tax=Cadophora gregata TaxID=51156 RepID=UPI0026DB4B60|nr:uncharacterized protein ONS95_007525 [Cadophora gregata]KAK0125901.1 hypothetical protein ONS95_007525 [Cadophora gregata]
MPSTHQKPTYLTISTSPSSAPPSPPPPSETEIYSVAKVAYSKLVSEAALKDQNLRRLVCHANLYDKLLDEYNNCFSDEESDVDTETDSWDGDVEDVEEFATQAYYTTAMTARKVGGGGRDAVQVREQVVYVYEDREQQRGRGRGRQVVRSGEMMEEAVLCKVASHSTDLGLGYHPLGGHAEVEGDFDE